MLYRPKSTAMPVRPRRETLVLAVCRDCGLPGKATRSARRWGLARCVHCGGPLVRPPRRHRMGKAVSQAPSAGLLAIDSTIQPSKAKGALKRRLKGCLRTSEARTKGLGDENSLAWRQGPSG